MATTNPWLKHVKKVSKQNKGKSFKEVLKIAKKSYTKKKWFTMKKKTSLKFKFWLTFIVGITFAYFLWLSWQKLTEYLGNSNIVWCVTGGIVLLAIFFGYFSINKITKRFT